MGGRLVGWAGGCCFSGRAICYAAGDVAAGGGLGWLATCPAITHGAAMPFNEASCRSGKRPHLPLTVQGCLQLRRAAAGLLRRSKHAACTWASGGFGPFESTP